MDHKKEIKDAVKKKDNLVIYFFKKIMVHVRPFC